MNRCVLENCVFSGSISDLQDCTVRTSVLWGRYGLVKGPSSLVDSIVKNLDCKTTGTRLQTCNILEVAGTHSPNAGFFSANPQFANPKMLDYRLMPTSPCRGKASDGGDLGVRYTPEMLEMLKLAFALRQRGIIEF